jgi:hypothetical protein
MNLLKAGGAALDTPSPALGYLARRLSTPRNIAAHMDIALVQTDSPGHHEHCRELLYIYGRQLPADNAAERDCLSVPL